MRSMLKSRIRRFVAGEPSRPRRALGPHRATVVAVAAQKGGVGKTTTAVNLASALARFHGRKVLLIDLDPQGHVHTAPGEDLGAEVMDVATSTRVAGLDVTPLDPQLAHAENLLGTRMGKEFVLREALVATRTWYDTILVDCPPNLGNLTVNALVAADYVLIPADPSPLALSGVHAIVETVGEVARRLNPGIDILGVLLTRVDGRTRRLNEAIVSEMERDFGDILLPVRIGIHNRLAQAQHEGVDIFDFDPEGRGARHYRELADHVVRLLDEAR